MIYHNKGILFKDSREVKCNVRWRARVVPSCTLYGVLLLSYRLLSLRVASSRCLFMDLIPMSSPVGLLCLFVFPLYFKSFLSRTPTPLHSSNLLMRIHRTIHISMEIWIVRHHYCITYIEAISYIKDGVGTIRYELAHSSAMVIHFFHQAILLN